MSRTSLKRSNGFVAEGAPDVSYKRARQLRVGSDCSGLGAATLAMQSLGVAFTECFSSDINEWVCDFLKENYTCKKIFGDIAKREVSSVPKVNIYSSGFPCTPFSSFGKGEGLQHSDGQVGLHVVEYIAEKKPDTFVLENVEVLPTKHKEFFALIIAALRGIKTAQGNIVYQVRWKILNARDYGAVCSRPRVYIVGIKGEQKRKQFHWPVKSVAPPLSRFLIDGHTDSDSKNRQFTASEALALERSVQAHLVSRNRRLDTKAIVDAGIGFTNNGMVIDGCPCLMKNHCQSSSYIVLPEMRRLSSDEMCLMMGIPTHKVTLPESVTPRRWRGMIGNSMYVPLMKELFARALYACGLTLDPIGFDYEFYDDTDGHGP